MIYSTPTKPLTHKDITRNANILMQMANYVFESYLAATAYKSLDTPITLVGSTPLVTTLGTTSLVDPKAIAVKMPDSLLPFHNHYLRVTSSVAATSVSYDICLLDDNFGLIAFPSYAKFPGDVVVVDTFKRDYVINASPDAAYIIVLAKTYEYVPVPGLVISLEYITTN